jgi:phosphatidylserine/phosphatidylglycerophosphate/cardiolipin synthase-like enzyme
MGSSQIALLVDAVADSRAAAPNPSEMVDLVLSGPELAGIPTSDTAAIMRRLIDEAVSEMLLVGYAVYQGKEVFERLATKMDENPGFKVWLCLDIPRKQADASPPREIIRRFANDFRQNHWPGKRLPELFYDPRSLSESRDKRSSLHAKCVIIDRRVALITSANFTQAAYQRNIEAGVIVRYPSLVERLVGYFEGLRASGQLVGFSCEPE